MTTPKHSLSREATQMPKYTDFVLLVLGKVGERSKFSVYFVRDRSFP